MTKTELLEIIANRENSGVELKRDDITNFDLAKEIVAFLNFQGGMLLLGVDDDGSIYGTGRPDLEEWVAELCRVKIDPPVIPYLAWVRDVEPGKDVLIVQFPSGPDKPYARVHSGRNTYYIRVGSTSREASREELQRLFQSSGYVQYGLKPVPGAGLEMLDFRRLKDYFGRILRSKISDAGDIEGWERLLLNMEFMVKSGEIAVATVDGMLLFGKNPKRFLPQSGIRALAYPGLIPDLAAKADEILQGALLPLCNEEGEVIETGLLEQALEFVRRNTGVVAHLEDGARRVERWSYPETVLRETIVNALVHRDYSIAGTDITLSIFADRLEVESPGRLPNTATVEALRTGFRYARNQTLVNVMRDYRYVDFRGMGIREKIIPGMLAHNGTEPDFIADERRFIVRLWKEPKAT
jgi:ATP-dependent DNA helicase RecG